LVGRGDKQQPRLCWRDPWYWGLPVVALLLALIVAVLGDNAALFAFLNEHLPGGDRWWGSLTVFGDTLVALSLLLPLCGRYPRLVWAAVLAAILVTLWIQGLKSGFSLPRPAAVLGSSGLHIIGPELHSRSFPSGHTATAFLLAAVLVLGLRPALIWRWLIVIFALLIGLSRIAVGAHWPLDVLVGAASAWLIAGLALPLASRFPVGCCLIGQRIIAGLLLAVCLYLLFYYDSRYLVAEPLPMLIALFALLLAWQPLRQLFARPPL